MYQGGSETSQVKPATLKPSAAHEPQAQPQAPAAALAAAQAAATAPAPAQLKRKAEAPAPAPALTGHAGGGAAVAGEHGGARL